MSQSEVATQSFKFKNKSGVVNALALKNRIGKYLKFVFSSPAHSLPCHCGIHQDSNEALARLNELKTRLNLSML
jgi:hypothetical protein